MNEIIVNQGVKNRILKTIKTSYPTIRKALKGEGDSVKCMKIRKIALELGGEEI